jgi:hypothetical protein
VLVEQAGGHDVADEVHPEETTRRRSRGGSGGGGALDHTRAERVRRCARPPRIARSRVAARRGDSSRKRAMSVPTVHLARARVPFAPCTCSISARLGAVGTLM